eukprot:4331677-Lingulodinium_polyedra.AAC.1
MSVIGARRNSARKASDSQRKKRRDLEEVCWNQEEGWSNAQEQQEASAEIYVEDYQDGYDEDYQEDSDERDW